MHNLLTASKMAGQWVRSSELGKKCSTRRTPLIGEWFTYSLSRSLGCIIRPHHILSLKIFMTLSNADLRDSQLASKSLLQFKCQGLTITSSIAFSELIFVFMSRVATSSDHNYFPLDIIKYFAFMFLFAPNLSNMHPGIFLFSQTINFAYLGYAFFNNML